MTIEDSEMQALLDAACEAAIAAGRAILPIASEVVEVEEKGDGSPLTRADRASDEIIAAALENLEPRFPILSEEGDLTQSGVPGTRTASPGSAGGLPVHVSQTGIPGTRTASPGSAGELPVHVSQTGIPGTRTASPGSAGGLPVHVPTMVYWCVDPLDGTKEFIKGLDEYTVNIALVRDAMPILGVVYVPAQDVLYYASEGNGAWRTVGGGEPERIHATGRARPTSAVVSRSHLSAATEAFLTEYGITDVVQHGSSLKICAVAEGSADLYPRHGPTCLWDTAAGSAVAIESGCRVVDLDGRPLRFDPAEGIKHAGFIVHPASMQI